MPFSRDLLNPEIEPASPVSPALAGGFFTTSATLEVPYDSYINMLIKSAKLSLGIIPYTLEMSLESLI